MTTRLTPTNLDRICRRAGSTDCVAILVMEFGDYEFDERYIAGDNFVYTTSKHDLAYYIFSGYKTKQYLEISSVPGIKLYKIPVEHIAKMYMVKASGPYKGSIVRTHTFTSDDGVLREKTIYAETDEMRSVLGYQGNKFRIAGELLDLMPKRINRFYDVFGGSAVMSASVVSRSNKVVYNDYDKNIVNILRYLRDCDPYQFIDDYDQCVKDNKLEWPKGKKTPKNVAVAKANYYRFRGIVNSSLPVDPLQAIVLSKHAYCSLFRFNLKGGFNYAYGERSWRKSEARDKIIYEFVTALKSVKINRSRWQTFIERILNNWEKGDVVYLDPPYLASGYNVYKGSWSEQDEVEILNAANLLSRCGIKVMISNVLTHRGKINQTLIDFVAKSKFRCIRVAEGKEIYSVSRITTDDVQETEEVALINYYEE